MNPISNASAAQAASRVMARCDSLAEISETPDLLTRVYLSPEHMRANKRVGEWMMAAGMRIWQDSVGNICGRYEGAEPDAPALLLGSHLDTVRNAGRYDGMLGVLTAIEVVQALHQQGKRLPLAIEIVGFADEEGTRFGITLLGSRGITGSWPECWVNHSDGNSITVAEAMADIGLDAAAIGQAAREVKEIVAYLELHIEQGPCLEQENLALGVVTAINGARRLNCRFIGEAGHAGTVPMMHRKDALAAAAEWVMFIEQAVPKHGPQLVATVGTLQCQPGAVNVIPGEVTLTLDVRGPEDNALAGLLSALLTQAEAIASHRSVSFSAEEYYQIPATRCDEQLQALIRQAITEVQGRSLALPSGAGHDAIAMAERWPVGMLFVRCERGISHHPAESVLVEDVAKAIQVYGKVVCDVASWREARANARLTGEEARSPALSKNDGGWPWSNQPDKTFMALENFNQASADEATRQLAQCVALESWISALVAARPYASLGELLHAGDKLARRWDEQALTLALSAHPRIGEKVQGKGKEADLSRAEQGKVNRADYDQREALRTANVAYEARFRRIFLIRAKGRSGEDVLAELYRRLTNDPQRELQEALDQLREITLLRLKETFL